MQLEQLGHLFAKETSKLEQEFITIRRHLHKYPELSFMEFETSSYVEKQLNDWGISNKRVGDTGIVAWITGQKEELPSDNYTIGLRADMDALPIKEETGLPFSSVHEGIMHACGHDGHTTILLGAARILHENRKHFSGKVVCVFQPGEEDDGAAKEMIRLGVLNDPKIDGMIALHLWPYLPFGTVGVKSGSMTASCDDFTIEFFGKSGHSARPHEGIDAISVSMQLMQVFQHMVVKMNNPLDPVVVHIGKISGGTARNVVADYAVLEGTTRSLTIENREKVATEIKRLSEEIAATYNTQVRVTYKHGNAPVINDEQLTKVVAEAVREQWGSGDVTELKQPSLGADDFGEFALEVPSSYFRLGIKSPDKETYSLHHPKFDFDDRLVSKGAAIFAYTALKAIYKMEDK
ncbi:M20 metallopeptidase family protein [Virgibacillus sp. W0181]|uniref:M20 metallopeptidase family protein n=1 Tax=Virgibacillus sp. W0181 TaxID=3391581 RepID=UPI003F45A6BD